MNTRRLATTVVVGSVVLGAGCSRLYARRDRDRNLPPLSPPVPTVPVSAPAPPLPPPDPAPPPAPAVALPRADAVTAGIVPSMPGPGGPAAAQPDDPGPGITPATATSAEGIPPVRGRLEEMRRRREERREDRRDPDPKPTSPGLPPTLPAPTNTPPAQKPPESAPSTDLAAVKALVDAARSRWATVPEFEARLTKREVVAGKPLPQNEVLYRFRKQPLSLYMLVQSGPGEGRELLYVQGRYGDKVHIVTGKGDNRLVGVGFKTELDPDDRQLTAKSRYKVTEAGLGRIIAGLTKAVDVAERDPGVKIRATGAVTRREYPYPLVGIEGQVRPGDDPQLPRGGTRQVFFDPNPKSVGHNLPVLVVTTEPDGREIEYYCFDQFKIPTGLTDADWSPDRLKRR